MLAFMATACNKESNDRLRILSEDMRGDNKVWVNPTNASASASWVSGELIDLNGAHYSIARDGDGYYLDADEDALPDNLYAIYPATGNADGNDITVTNNGASASTVVIRQLTVNFRDGGHDIIFPMATGMTDKTTGKLLFKHLSGGLRLTLTDTASASNYTLGSLKVVVYGDGAAPTALTAHNVTTRWATQGPVLPSGEIGEINGNQFFGYASEMHFKLTTDGMAGKSIPDNGSISLCVPVTVTPVKRLVISGYGTDGTQLFVRDKELPSAHTIQTNYMYNIPTIEF